MNLKKSFDILELRESRNESKLSLKEWKNEIIEESITIIFLLLFLLSSSSLFSFSLIVSFYHTFIKSNEINENISTNQIKNEIINETSSSFTLLSSSNTTLNNLNYSSLPLYSPLQTNNNNKNTPINNNKKQSKHISFFFLSFLIIIYYYFLLEKDLSVINSKDSNCYVS